MDDIERRLIILEQHFAHERERVNWRLEGLSRQLLTLQAQQSATPTLGSLVKILLALLLPILVWLMTGDLKEALKAGRLVGG